MARSSAAGNTYYRVVVEYAYDSQAGRTSFEHFGPYSKLGVARSMLNRHRPIPPKLGNKPYWRRVNASHIESITGEWTAVDG